MAANGEALQGGEWTPRAAGGPAIDGWEMTGTTKKANSFFFLFLFCFVFNITLFACQPRIAAATGTVPSKKGTPLPLLLIFVRR